MMRKLLEGLILTGLVAGVTSGCLANEPTAADVQVKFSKLLRNTKITSVRPSPVRGLYEVIAGPNVFYFSPAGDGHLLFGQIVDHEGKNLTSEIQGKLREEFQKAQETRAAEILKNLPLGKALKIGEGPNTVIEFTDPDCPYCRRVDNFLSKRNDVTRYVFLFPLDQLHPNSRAKAMLIWNSKDRAQAFRDVFAGKYDHGGLPIGNDDFAKYPVETQHLVDSANIGKQLGVQGTPMLFVNGNLVNGADTNRIASLLNKR